MTTGWQQLQADTEAANRADSEHHASSTAGNSRPSRRTPDMNPPSVTRPDPAPSPEHEPEQDDRAARLSELRGRARESAQRIAAQETERQAGNEYAARIEREAQTQPEAEWQAEARHGAEIEM